VAPKQFFFALKPVASTWTKTNLSVSECMETPAENS
jgi:hypothetical protein